MNQAGPAWQRQRKQVQCTPQLSPGRARAAPAARAATRPTTPTSGPRPGMRGGAEPEQGEGAAGVAEGVGVRGQGAGGEQVGARLVLALAGLVQGDGALRRHGADPRGRWRGGAGGAAGVVNCRNGAGRGLAPAGALLRPERPGAPGPLLERLEQYLTGATLVQLLCACAGCRVLGVAPGSSAGSGFRGSFPRGPRHVPRRYVCLSSALRKYRHHQHTQRSGAARDIARLEVDHSADSEGAKLSHRR